jgi:hypothetical protein
MNFLKQMLVTGFILGTFVANARPDEQDLASKRLEFMKTSAQVYTFSTGTNDIEELKLQPEPLLRWTNPVSGLKDGTLFFWTTAEGRPYAAAQVFQIESGVWLHEFQSLTTSSFRVIRDGRTIWAPTKPGIEWKPVPNAPAPAKNAAQRLTQMKAIVERFGASDDFEGSSRWELRLLPKPLLRYSSSRGRITDGATFAFVHTTDPEIFVTIEGFQENGQDPKWRYSLAPMTAYALKVTLDDQTIWEKKWLKEPFPIASPYFILDYKP